MFYFFVCLFICFKINLFLLFFSPSRETLETNLALLKVSFATQSKYVTSEILVQLRSPKASSVNAYNWEHATLLISFDDVHLFPRYLFRSLILHRVMAWEIGSVLRGYQAVVCNSRHDKSVCFPGTQRRKCLHLKHLIADSGKVVVLVRYRWLSRFRSGILTPDSDQCGGYRSLGIWMLTQSFASLERFQSADWAKGASVWIDVSFFLYLFSIFAK